MSLLLAFEEVHTCLNNSGSTVYSNVDTLFPGQHRGAGQQNLFQKTKPDKNVPVCTGNSRACVWAGCVGILKSNRKIRAYWNTEGSAGSGKVECP